MQIYVNLGQLFLILELFLSRDEQSHIKSQKKVIIIIITFVHSLSDKSFNR